MAKKLRGNHIPGFAGIFLFIGTVVVFTEKGYLWGIITFGVGLFVWNLVFMKLGFCAAPLQDEVVEGDEAKGKEMPAENMPRANYTEADEAEAKYRKGCEDHAAQREAIWGKTICRVCDDFMIRRIRSMPERRAKSRALLERAHRTQEKVMMLQKNGLGAVPLADRMPAYIAYILITFGLFFMLMPMFFAHAEANGWMGPVGLVAVMAGIMSLNVFRAIASSQSRIENLETELRDLKSKLEAQDAPPK